MVSPLTQLKQASTEVKVERNHKDLKQAEGSFILCFEPRTQMQTINKKNAPHTQNHPFPGTGAHSPHHACSVSLGSVPRFDIAGTTGSSDTAS